MYDKRLKGGKLWRRITEAEARSLVGDDFDLLERSITQETPFAFVRRRPEPQPQPNLPGVGEGPGAYGRE